LVRPRLESITLRGFKTICELKDFAPGPLTVLIGPNGAGKSNFISAFRLLSNTVYGGLQGYIVQQGGANALLHDGSERTRDIEIHLRLVADFGPSEYLIRLAHAAGDTLIFTEEKYRLSSSTIYGGQRSWTVLDPGRREAGLPDRAEAGENTARAILSLLRKIAAYQFHNTSGTSRIRQRWDAEDGRRLKDDAGNLGPFLLRLSIQRPEYYRRILETIRLVLPFFAEFDLEPEYGSVLLRWREKGSDRAFHAGQAADGMLRIMALTSLLQQPPDDLPDVLILDEPELGLHPFAIEVIAELIRAVSKSTQVIIATQSVSLIDRFAPGEVVVVDREQRETKFRPRLDADELKSWLEAYSLSELWEKNVIGGRPAR
jgi:predicted ATPase